FDDQSDHRVPFRPNSGRNGAKWSIWVVHIPAGGAASRWAVRCNVPAGSVSPRMTVRQGRVKLPSGVGHGSSVPAANPYRPILRAPMVYRRRPSADWRRLALSGQAGSAAARDEALTFGAQSHTVSAFDRSC